MFLARSPLSRVPLTRSPTVAAAAPDDGPVRIVPLSAGPRLAISTVAAGPRVTITTAFAGARYSITTLETVP